MRRAFFVIIAVLVVVVVALDRIGLLIADHQIASRVKTSQGLSSSPSVSIKGFPFLTQVLGGRYQEVDVTVHDVTRNGLTVDTVSVRAHGVSVPLSQVISGSVKEVPVDRTDARVTLGLEHVNAYLQQQIGSGLRVSGDNGNLKLTGTLPFPPHASLSAGARIDVSGGSITLRPTAIDSVVAMIPGVARSLVEQFFTVKLPISQLPFGIELKSATVEGNAVVIAASAAGLTLRAPSS